MYSIRRTTNALADDADGIAQSQTPVAGGDLNLDGALVEDGKVVLPEAQIITFTFAGNDAGRTLTISYKGAGEKPTTTTVSGVDAGTRKTAFYVKEIYSISIDAASAGAIEVGVVAADGMITQPIQVNRLQSPFNISLFVENKGSGTYSMQFSPDDPQEKYPSGYSTDAWWRDVVGMTAIVDDDSVSNIAFPVEAVRLKITSGVGPLKYTILEGQHF